MKKKNSSLYFLALVVATLPFLSQSCKKHEPESQPLSLSVDLPRSVIHNDLFYTLDHGERSVELDFSEPIDPSTIQKNISFSDKSGNLDSSCTFSSYGRKVFISFDHGFRLRPGWKYFISIKTDVRSTGGTVFSAPETIEIRTTDQHLMLENDFTLRNTIICISDIHMGDSRSVPLGYCWFSKNAAALEDLLDTIQSAPQVRELVILGDLFDEWVVPYRMAPFDTGAGVFNSDDYFHSVASSPVNAGVISKLRSIAASGTIRLVYVPGNHDMLLTQDVLGEIIPGIIWQGSQAGLGKYSPFPEIRMEHGHRYDLFNCPQPNIKQGQILPPGYFVSRLNAEGLMERKGQSTKAGSESSGKFEFLTAWIAAVEYLKFQYSMTLAPDSINILMGGIDNYHSLMSFNGVRDMYASKIEEVWQATQTSNEVPVSMPVIMGILDGNTDLYFTSGYEFMQSAAPEKFRIVVFGHTHNPMLKVYPAGKSYSGIYANTGSWVNSDLGSKPVRTFISIKPGEWTGSDLDVVSLFQYTLESGSGNSNPDYIPVKISEESIDRF